MAARCPWLVDFGREKFHLGAHQVVVVGQRLDDVVVDAAQQRVRESLVALDDPFRAGEAALREIGREHAAFRHQSVSDILGVVVLLAFGVVDIQPDRSRGADAHGVGHLSGIEPDAAGRQSRRPRTASPSHGGNPSV